MAKLNSAQKTELETKFLDRSTVHDVLEAIAEICGEKADHIRENWQDQETARVWDSTGAKIEKLAAKIDV